MSELQTKLNEVVASLGTAKFDVPTVLVSDIIARQTDDSLNPVVLIDVRSEEERISTIKGSITRAEFEANAEKYADKECVCFCTVGYISGAVACELRRAGHSNVKNMGDGALLGYTLAQTTAGITKPLVDMNGEETNVVHTFMPDLAPLAGEGMVGKSFEDPGAVLAEANKNITAKLGL
jgi:rhodanese-related sulfurtransferase